MTQPPQALVGAVILVLFVLIAVFAPLLAPYGEHEQVGAVFEPPVAPQHPLGLDDGGFDMLSACSIYGARVSLIVGFAAALVAMVIGGTVGLLAGYFGGKTDIFLMRITDYFLVIPDVPLMLVVAARLGPQPAQHHHHHRAHLLDQRPRG